MATDFLHSYMGKQSRCLTLNGLQFANNVGILLYMNFYVMSTIMSNTSICIKKKFHKNSVMLQIYAILVSFINNDSFERKVPVYYCMKHLQVENNGV